MGVLQHHNRIFEQYRLRDVSPRVRDERARCESQLRLTTVVQTPRTFDSRNITLKI